MIIRRALGQQAPYDDPITRGLAPPACALTWRQVPHQEDGGADDHAQVEQGVRISEHDDLALCVARTTQAADCGR
jgi:hypothetical protein